MEVAMSTATIPAKPLIPSMIFKACVQPPTAIMVKNKEIGQKAKIQSIQPTPTRDTPPMSHQAIAAEAKAANKRLREPTSLVMSSTKPAIKTGSAAINDTDHSQVNVILLGPKTKSPARLPA